MTTVLGSGNQDFLFERGSGGTLIKDFKSTYFQADMAGTNEVPPNSSTTAGVFTGWLNFDQTRLDFSGDFTGLDFDGAQTGATNADNVTGMHIHNAPAGSNGPVVFDIRNNSNTVQDASAGTVRGVWKQADNLSAINIDKLFADTLYVNVHTVNFPGGEIRGQLLAVDEGADRIDLTSLHIGTFDSARLITATVNGDAVMTVFTNGVAAKLRLDGVSLAELNAADFIFEDATPRTVMGSAGRDDLFSGNGDDTIKAAGGNDRLFGDGGNDSLRGGAGNDVLYGGTGKDTLLGGADADTFVFRKIAEGSRQTSEADVIADYQAGEIIDLSAIDADTGVAGNQAFVLNTGGPLLAGQLRVATVGTDTLILLKTNSSSTVDMKIKLLGVHSLTVDDFVL